MILSIDLSLWTFVLCLMGIGYWMSRTKVKAWAVPINTLLLVISVVLATVWGLLLEGVSFHAFMTYGLPNGLVCWLGATTAYDFIHEYAKRKEDWLSVWKSFLALLKKKEAKA